MGKTNLTIETDDSLPPEVLREHVQWAMDDLTKEVGGATVTLDTPNARSHPFEGGVEMFDDYPKPPATGGDVPGGYASPFANGGYVPGTSREGSFIAYNSSPGYVIPPEVAERVGTGVIGRALKAIKDGREARGEV